MQYFVISTYYLENVKDFLKFFDENGNLPIIEKKVFFGRSHFFNDSFRFTLEYFGPYPLIRYFKVFPSEAELYRRMYDCYKHFGETGSLTDMYAIIPIRKETVGKLLLFAS